MSQARVDRAIEVSSEPLSIDAFSTQSNDLVARDEGTPAGSNRPEFGDGFAVAGHDEGLACRHRVNDAGILVAQFSLRDRLRHWVSVAS